MPQEPDYILDVSRLRASASDDAEAANLARKASGATDDPAGRPWIGVRFDCCGVYQRVYRNPEGTAYVGRCPRCGREARARVGPSGVSARFFVAD
ncbi:MAG: hypothetical protein KJ057_10730 [Phycisphaerae bacterium]|nr:MAG: hypothetical protein F9K17_13930 [Phycisphaerae bacterium]MBE7455036.1 hypothetical protein [Planctomycetia bacterium]MCK6464729.1 hypothetical protein [Phycisphaerae bacterium]MCL4718935.1 hypothetical protein [Phycisphaerae bacterium]NUQ10110.1 hypothetical protein [Phycisphaerae bacterium]